MHVHEYPIVKEDASVAYDLDYWDGDMMEGEILDESFEDPPELTGISTSFSSDSASHEHSRFDPKFDHHKDDSFDTNKTMNTITTMDSSRASRRTTRSSTSMGFLAEEGLSRSSPMSMTAYTDISFGSTTSSISELKMKKRVMERTFERSHPRFPAVLDLPKKEMMMGNGR